MEPLRIVKIIDVACDGLLDLLARHPCVLPQEFSFQCLEKAVRDSIVPAVSLSAHEHDKAMSKKDLAVIL